MTDPTVPDDPQALRTMLCACAGGRPDNIEIDNGPWDFLLRQPADRISTLIIPVVTDLLLHEDPDVRRQVISVLVNAPGSESSFDRLLAAAQQTQLFKTDDLVSAMTNALASTTGKRGPEAAAAIRELIGDRAPPSGTATILATYQPEYAIAAVDRYRDAIASFAAQIAAILAFYHRDRLLPYLRMLSNLKPEIRKDAWTRMQPFLSVSAENAALHAIHLGLEPAKNPMATNEQCRVALDL